MSAAPTGTVSVDIFCGPTLPEADAARLAREAGLHARVHGPVAQGDVLAAVRHGTDAILIIDGVYERTPAVWHKEILHALDEGLPVVGCSSMGALRAAECAEYGMSGVGEVYRQVSTGEIVADADVAVAHLGPDDDYRATSVALVDLRATVDALLARGELTTPTAEAVVAAARTLFFPERRLPTIAARAASDAAARTREAAGTGADADRRIAGRTETAAQELLARLRDGFVSVKRADAETAIAALPELVHAWEPARDWTFQHSQAWRQASARADSAVSEQVLDLVRLEERWTDVLRAGLVRHLVTSVAPSADVQPDVALAELRGALGVDDDGAVAWAASVGLAPRQLRAFAVAQAQLARCWEEHGAGALAAVGDHLRAEGTWHRLTQAVHERQELLARTPLSDLADDDLWRWWCETTGRDGDPESAAAELGFDDAAQLLRAVRIERTVAEAQQ